MIDRSPNVQFITRQIQKDMNTYALCIFLVISGALTYQVKVTRRDSEPILSYQVQNNSAFKQVFNPTWMEASQGTDGRQGLIVRTQNCPFDPEKCVFCGGGANKASILTFSREVGEKQDPITRDSIVFTPHNFSDSWGTQDPRMTFHPKERQYYMTYTAYNGSSILMNLARSPNPTDPQSWQRLGPIFPNYQNSKSGAILVRDSSPHYLFWGDSSIRVVKSDQVDKWPDIGQVLISPRQGNFDSKLVESGPPPLRLSDGNYIFFYNSAEEGWPEDRTKAYHVGWLILDKSDPSKVIERSESPLMGPEFPWQKGQAPYSCNVPNVVFLEAAYSRGGNRFTVFYGGGDATIGSAQVEVSLSSIHSE